MVVALATGCATGPESPGEPPPLVASDFRPTQIRQPALFVAVTLKGDWAEREKTAWPQDYEGLLLEGFNARAVLVKDVRSGAAGSTLDRRVALARAREVGADHAILVDARAVSETVTVCQEAGRPRRGQALVWRQTVEVLRASDGATRLAAGGGPALMVTDADVDCRTGQARRREPAAVMRDAVERLLSRLLGP